MDVNHSQKAEFHCHNCSKAGLFKVIGSIVDSTELSGHRLNYRTNARHLTLFNAMRTFSFPIVNEQRQHEIILYK